MVLRATRVERYRWRCWGENHLPGDDGASGEIFAAADMCSFVDSTCHAPEHGVVRGSGSGRGYGVDRMVIGNALRLNWPVVC